jgi:hypothetical protein
MGLFLNLHEYGDGESQAIARLGQKHGMLGEAWTFISNRRSVAEFEAFIRGERKLRRSMRRERRSCSAL